MTASIRERNRVMRIVIDFYQTNSALCCIETNHLYSYGLSRKSNAEHIVSVLVSMGFLKYRVTLDGARFIVLTSEGHHYFEKKADDKRAHFIDRALAILAILISIIALAKQ